MPTTGISNDRQNIHPVSRLVRFGIVGATGVLVNLGFYAVFHDFLGVYYLLAGALAIELSIINNFIWNERWTFRDRAARGWVTYLKRVLAFHLSSGLVAMVAQLLTLYVLRMALRIDAAGNPRWKDKMAYLIGIGLGALINYFICNLLIFKHKKSED